MRTPINKPKIAFAVFLDSDLVYHSDFLHHGIAAPISENNYYPLLNQFFDKIEQQLGMPVIIAAHPRSRYDLRPDLLKGRNYVIGQTADLVRESNLVFLHISTAQSFAVLWEKPMAFLTSDKLAASYFGPEIVHNAEIYKKKPINMNELNQEKLDQGVLLSIDKAAYSNYRQLYLKKHDSPDKPLWDIFSDYIHDNDI